MTLEAVAAGAASEDERGQHGQRCENALHVSPPFARLSRIAPGFFVSSSGGLAGDLRGYLGPIPPRHQGITIRNAQKNAFSGTQARSRPADEV